MKLITPIEISSSSHCLSLHSRVAFIGSCFAEHIGARMRQSGLPALVNPFGVLYNPLSILSAFTADLIGDDLYFCDEAGRWHCWLSDSHFDASSLASCRAALLSARGRFFEWNPQTVIITLGTNHCYELADNGRVVGNCHKRPQATFNERVLSVNECVEALEQLCHLMPHVHFLCTVSPFRYAKHGFHGSQLAKATLLLAIDELMQRHPQQVSYFPAYEILLDELRDYRFYAPDMLHPSEQAIDYIWERFVDQCTDSETKRYLYDYEPIRKALAHRPLQPESAAALRFREQTQRQLQQLMEKYHIDF